MSGKYRKYDAEFKERALERLEGCPNVSALARELGIRRKWLYAWRDARILRSGAEPKGRRNPEAPAAGDGKIVALEKQISELQRSLGQKSLENDFFRNALRRIEETRRSSRESGENRSTPKFGA